MNDQRTNQQSKLTHVYCQEVADVLNEHGITLQLAIKEQMDIPWDKDLVKRVLWHRVQAAMFDTTSTKDLTKEQVSRVGDVIAKHLADNFQIDIPFVVK